jgi:hypothetical protein
VETIGYQQKNIPILDEMSVYILWEGATITSVSSPAKSVEVLRSPTLVSGYL